MPKHPEGRRTNPRRESDPRRQPRTAGAAGASPGNTLRGKFRPDDKTGRGGPVTPRKPPPPDGEEEEK